MIILVGGEKGGTGKSTVATTLAAMAVRRGVDVVLIDADPQGTSTIWAEERQAGGYDPAVTCYAKTVARAAQAAKGQEAKASRAFINDLQDLATRYETVIIDAGGRDSKELRAGLVLADLFITPMQPSHADAWTLDRLEQLVGEASVINADLQTGVVISRAFTNPNMPEVEEATALLAEYDLLGYSGVTLYERSAYRRALGMGLCAEEMPDAKAKTETEDLYRYAFES